MDSYSSTEERTTPLTDRLHKCYSVIGTDYKKTLLSDYNRKITWGRLVAPDVD